MAHPYLGKRKRDDRQGARSKKNKIVKQQHYSSSGSEGSPSPNTVDEIALTISGVSSRSEPNADTLITSNPSSDLRKYRDRIVHADRSSTTSSNSNSDSDPDTHNHLRSGTNNTKISKRNDPSAFANSISAILSSRLTSTKRADPVLARSTIAAQANSEIAAARLEAQAKGKLREGRIANLEKGRVKDVLLGSDALNDRCISNKHSMIDINMNEAVSNAGHTLQERQELEKRLRKTAQRGVVKLFNAVREAQLRAEEAGKERGGRSRKEIRAGQMSREGFLEMVGGRSDMTAGTAEIREKTIDEG